MPCHACTSEQAAYHCELCNTANYCSKACQITDWNSGAHKKVCATVAGASVDVHESSHLARLANAFPDTFGATSAAKKANWVRLNDSTATRAVITAVQSAAMHSGKHASDGDSPDKKHASSAAPGLETLPTEMVVTLFKEMGLATALYLSQKSPHLRAAFKRPETTSGIFDAIVSDGTHSASQKARLLRIAVKRALDGVYGGARDVHTKKIIAALSPKTFTAMFLALGRPGGYDDADYSGTKFTNYSLELHYYWYSNIYKQKETSDFTEWALLHYMCQSPTASRVSDPAILILHICRINANKDLFVALIKQLASTPSAIHLDFETFITANSALGDDHWPEDNNELVVAIFEHSTHLHAHDWANLWYYSHSFEINGKEYGNPWESLNMPVIPAAILARLPGTFTDPTVDADKKFNDWKGIEGDDKNGVSWINRWVNDISRRRPLGNQEFVSGPVDGMESGRRLDPGVWLKMDNGKWMMVENDENIRFLSDDDRSSKEVTQDKILEFVQKRVAMLKPGGDAVHLFYFTNLEGEPAMAVYALLDENGRLFHVRVGPLASFGALTLPREYIEDDVRRGIMIAPYGAWAP